MNSLKKKERDQKELQEKLQKNKVA